MSWFDEQIKLKKKIEAEQFSQAFEELSAVLTGNDTAARIRQSNSKKQEEAILQIMNYYRVKPGRGQDTYRDLNDQLEYLLRPSGMMYRKIFLEEGWYKNSIGALLGFTEAGECVALLPRKRGYEYFDYAAGKTVRLSKRTEGLLKKEAICFYKPLPAKALKLKDLAVFMMETLKPSDYAYILVTSAMVSVVGMIFPYITKLLYQTVIPSGNFSFLAAAAFMMTGVTISFAMFMVIKSIAMKKISIRISIATEAAVMGRVVALPMAFFKEHSAGELASRMGKIRTMCTLIINTVLWSLLSSCLSLMYIGQIFQFASALVLPALIITAISAGLTCAGIYMQTLRDRKSMEVKAKESGIIFDLFSGVQKIKLSGAEKRAFVKWINIYRKIVDLDYNPPMFLKIFSSISGAVTLMGSIILYYLAVKTHVAMADYMAFMASYAVVGNAFLRLGSVMGDVASVRASLNMARPIMEAAPENSYGREMVSALSGGIETSHLTFRYQESGPKILDDLSLKIKPGQYLAIVGATGCGKSTLTKILLGFEIPDSGAVYYDGRDLQKLDLKSLRQRIGTVLQNGALISGSVLSNILLCAPWLGVEEAWEAARISGLEDDIRQMPMGMATMISEGSGGISGGQRQRLMIARAVVSKPRILIFDEATSALDNITQKRVSQALDTMDCTRIVIAHRLSTIRECDRIIVLDKGKIVEDGSYEELIEKKGIFSDLVARQRV